MFLFKSHIIFEILRKLDYNFGMKESFENIAEFVKMIFFVLVSAHFMAILYHSIAQIDIYFNNSEQTWLHQANIVQNSSWSRYLHSYYVAS